LPIGSRNTHLLLRIPRVECHACQLTRQVPIEFAEPRRSYTHAFERYALDLSKHMTIQAVAEHLNVGWDTIKDIQQRHLEQHFAKPKLKHLRLLAIDEIAVGKGHRYLTVVLDLESGAVVFVGDGKGAQALEPFWRRLRPSGARIEAVAIDMSQAYILAVHEHLPQAVLVFDRFHVVKLFNDRLSEFRRELYREAKDSLHKEVLKGTRWLLLKNPENLAPERRERERLEEALRLNEPLAAAYYMNCTFRENLRPRRSLDQEG
jgi:transposase